ncbi:MAG: calcium-binding protein [Litoreibacter sp.]|nr:calcium-binding protein [Litoreibacter sp.]
MKPTTASAKPLFIAIGVALVFMPLAAEARQGGHANFETIDADGNGELSQEELQNRGRERFASADANSDGLLSKEELIASGEARMQERLTRRIDRMMEHRDENGDGLLSAEELAPPADRAANRFDKMDEDQSGGISKEEFEAAMKKRFRNGPGRHRD